MAKDLFHNLVKRLLEEDGWRITHDPFFVPVGKRNAPIDLGAERLLAAEKGAEKIVVEIKSFLGDSRFHDFHKALGQHNIYHFALEKFEPERELFLAMPLDAYEELFDDPFFEEVSNHFQVQILVFSSHLEKIILWKK